MAVSRRGTETIDVMERNERQRLAALARAKAHVRIDITEEVRAGMELEGRTGPAHAPRTRQVDVLAKLEDLSALLGAVDIETETLINGGGPVRGGGRVGMAIVPLTIEIIKQGAPWIIQQLALQGLKILTIAEVLEMISGQEFYSLDDVLAWVVNVLRGFPGDDGTIPFFGDDARGDPKDYRKGAVREGWYIKQITDYDYGKETSKKVWYKPYEDASRGKTGAVMNFRERCAYFQGKRVQAYDSRQAKYRAYKRGYGHGSGDQFMAQAIMGHTRPCAPQLFYTKGYRGAYRGRR